MRIIGGKLKNKKLEFTKSLTTRPLKDSVRENIFNILRHSNNFNIDIKKSYVFDIYAGTGSFGLECISREAMKVVFVENDLSAIKNLKKNIKNINCQDKTLLILDDILNFFNTKTLDFYKKKFNIVFLDPPYRNKKFIEIIKKLKNKDLVNKKHIIVVHREKNAKDQIENYLNIVENRIYGRSEIFFGKFF